MVRRALAQQAAPSPQEDILSCTPIISFSCSYDTKAIAMEGTTFT